MSITIQKLGHLGDGIAEGPIFAAMTLPGEVVEGEVENGRIAAPRILVPSEQRVKAPCRHFKACGGCTMQHASDTLVAGWKRDIVANALAAHGLPAPIRDVHTSPRQSRRRAVFSGRRTKRGALIGFHGRASGTIVDLAECHVVRPELFALRETMAALVLLGASRKGEVSLTATLTLCGVDLAAEGLHPLDESLRAKATALGAEAGLARLSWNGETIAQWQDPVLPFGKARVAPPPGAFLQATAEGEAALLAAVREAVGGSARIVDLFAGCGTFSLPLAEQAEVLAVEGEADMLAALDRGWRRAQGLKRVEVATRDLFRRPLLPDELSRFDAVVLDPPRAGAEAQVAELARTDVARIAYVSCNPQSFARDAAALCAVGYQLQWIDVVDQFRWSPHVELAAAFRRPGA
ncbi:23S rRNA (uracil(1939)-C(5))-methyltransferase RlmD [Pseudoruegeria aquimaris]|uniref:23S rRNA (Uracil(1939)-C(5))-methyltransferase RlmD n=1 Tax=Pseudoruegeria aquimaris TaxID=393663 RepID=A0A1Y5RT25_9RHOB|nr:class I SAM-dependent RNA methyltransferase [Pseudoruegeria aquimaris]SLN24848.1 23S rRNA (uracil(1939)-C(5))-methyltransferase RlmD [Pseudoruegeria aquimaris]